jgi:hypothetical protein
MAFENFHSCQNSHQNNSATMNQSPDSVSHEWHESANDTFFPNRERTAKGDLDRQNRWSKSDAQGRSARSYAHTSNCAPPSTFLSLPPPGRPGQHLQSDPDGALSPQKQEYNMESIDLQIKPRRYKARSERSQNEGKPCTQCKHWTRLSQPEKAMTELKSPHPLPPRRSIVYSRLYKHQYQGRTCRPRTE